MERQYIHHEWSDDHALLASQQFATNRAQLLLLAAEGGTADALITILGEAGYAVQQTPSLDDGVASLESDDPPALALIDSSADVAVYDAIGVLRAVAPAALRIIVVGEGAADADAQLDLPLQAPQVLRVVGGQLRTAEQIGALETGRATLLGTALLSLELNQSMRGELDAQRVLHNELLHRVQTHIGALRDYLELEVRRLPLGIAREAMRGVLYRVRSLSAMYETMATLSMEDPVDFGKLVGKISQGVKAMYSPRSKLPVVVEGQLQLSAASASPLTLVVNELVTNAYRHAFPGGRFGTIRVSCGREADRGWCVVADDGVGMDTPPRTRPNSGIQLVRQLVRRSLGGSCTWESAGPGTVARVQFPVADP